MAHIKCYLLFLIYQLISTNASQDSELFCVLKRSCLLPCSFQNGPNTVINWFKTPGRFPVHSYYHDQNQNEHQMEDYRGRTHLFVEEISKGNASLLLTDVKINNEGTYLCVPSTSTTNIKESSINVKVFAPVVEVEMQQEGDELKCRAEGIYPQPEVTWTPSTDSNTLFETHSGLYFMVSSIKLPDPTAEECTCNVSTPYSRWRATYRMNAQINISGKDLIIPCLTSKAPVKSLIWKFNHTLTILNRTGAEIVYHQSWLLFVDGVTKSNSLSLANVNESQQGLYSCILTTDTETFVIDTRVKEDTKVASAGIIILITVLVCFILVLGASCAWFIRKKDLRYKYFTRGIVSGLILFLLLFILAIILYAVFV